MNTTANKMISEHWQVHTPCLVFASTFPSLILLNKIRGWFTSIPKQQSILPWHPTRHSPSRKLLSPSRLSHEVSFAALKKLDVHLPISQLKCLRPFQE